MLDTRFPLSPNSALGLSSRCLFVAGVWLVLLNIVSAQVEQRLLSTPNAGQQYEAVSVTPDNAHAVAAYNEGLTAWNLKTGKQAFSLNQRLSDGIISKDGSRYVAWDDNTRRIMQLGLQGPPDSWTLEPIFPESEEDLEPLAVSTDGRLLACKIGYDAVGILDLTTKNVMFKTPGDSPAFVDFSPNGEQVSFSFDRPQDAVVTYSVPDGTLLAGSAAFIASAQRISFAPDGQSIAVCCVLGSKYSVVLLDSKNLRPIRGASFPVEASPSYCALDWSDDGQRICYVAETVGIFDYITKKQLTTLIGYEATALAFDRTGSLILTASDGYDAGVVCWDWQANLKFRDAVTSVASHARLDNYEDSKPVPLRLQYSHDGKILALAVPEPYQYGMKAPLQGTEEPGLPPSLEFGKLNTETAYIFFLDAESGKPTKAISSKAPGMRDSDGNELDGAMFDTIRFSPDDQTLTTLYRGGSEYAGHLTQWDIVATPPRLRMLLENDWEAWRKGWLDVAYADDGQSLLLLSGERNELGVQWLDLSTSTIKKSIQGQFGRSLLKLADGQFASGFATWDYLNGEELFRQNGGEAHYFGPLFHVGENAILGIDDDGERLARWSLDSLELAYPYAAHRGDPAIPLHAVAVSPDGSIVATGGGDHLIRLWTADTGKLIIIMRGHRRAVDALCFSPDGARLASASRDGTTRFWDVSDLGSGSAVGVAAALPTRRTFQTSAGATVTVTFDGAASEQDVVSALQDAQNQLKP